MLDLNWFCDPNVPPDFLGWCEVFTYIWNPTTQDAETVHSAIRATSTEIVTRIGFANVCCHGAQEVRIAVIRGSEIEVVDSRWVCSDTFVVKFGRQLDGAA
jgi:hypothetical protein